MALYLFRRKLISRNATRHLTVSAFYAGKFLIVSGKDVKRYEPVTSPDGVRGDIQKAIDASKAAA